MRKRSFLTIVLAVAMLISAPVPAQVNVVWDGSDSAVWGLNTNWVGDVLPTTVDDVEFNDVGLAGVGLTVDMNGASIEVNDMLISGGADGYDFVSSGGDLSIAELTHSATGTNTFSGDLYTTGAININAGRLAITGDSNGIGGAVNVSAGAILEARPLSLGVATIALNGGTASFTIGGTTSGLPTTGLLSHYSFDNTTLDTGSLANAAGTMVGAATYGPGKFGAASLSLSGADGTYFNTNVDGAYDFMNEGVSFSLWAQLDAGGWNDRWECLFGKGENNTYRLARRDNDQNDLSYANNWGGAGTGMDLTDTPNGTANDWHHIVITHGTDKTVRIYFDKVLKGTWTGRDITTNTTKSLLIGENPDAANRTFGGLIDEFLIYERVLDQTEVDSLYAGGTTIKSAVAGNLVMTDNDIDVTASSTLEVIVDAPSSASFGALTLTDGTLTIENSGTGTSFTALAPIAASAAVGIASDKNVTVPALSLGDGASFTFTGGSLNASTTAMTGAAATITVNSTYNGGALTLGGNLTASGAGDQNYTSIAAAPGAQTINITDGATITTPAFDDGDAANTLNVTGNGTLALGDTVNADDTAFTIGGTATLRAASVAHPMGAAGTAIRLDGGTFETAGESVGGYVYNQLEYNSYDGKGNFTNFDAIDDGVVNGENGGLLDMAPTVTNPAWTGNVTWANNSQPPARANAWSGWFKAPETGIYQFGLEVDDEGGVWVDINQNGDFEVNNGVGTELFARHRGGGYTSALTYTDLVAGQMYKYLVVGWDTGGNDRFNAGIDAPTGGKITINPSSATQEGWWATGSLIVKAISMPDTDFAVTANSNVVATTDSTATFGELKLTSGIVNVSGAAGGVTFNSVNAAMIPHGATTGITSANPVTLNGSLNVGDNVDLTLGGAPLTITGGIALNDDAADGIVSTIRVLSGAAVAWPGSFDQTGVETRFTKAGAGTLNMQTLGADTANLTAFITKDGGTLEFTGGSVGGSTQLNLDGGTIKVTGADVPVPAPAGAIAHYSFDDVAAGVAPDSSGSATTYDGTISGGATVAVAGGHDGGDAMDFNGSDSYIGLGTGVNPLDGQSAFTLAWWSNQDTHQQGAQISSDSHAGASRFIIQDATTGNAPVYANGDVFATTTMIADSEWHHYALTVDNPSGGAWKFYIDGSEAESATHNFTMSDFEFQMGKHVDIFFDGMMDDVYIYDTALNATQIGTLHHGAVTGPIDLSTADLVVTEDSTLDAVTPETAAFGSLTFDAAVVLTTSGADGGISFAGAALAAGENAFDTSCDTSPGPITVGDSITATVVKTGAADLILDPTVPTIGAGGSIAWDIRQGAVVAQAGSNPLVAAAPVEINGGELVLVSSAPGTPVTFDNPIASTGGTLTAGAHGGANIGPLTVTVGNASGNDLTLTSGTLLVRTTDDYTLNVAGNVTGAGNMAIAAGSTVSVAGTMDAATVTIDGALTVAGEVNVNDLIANTGGTYSGPSNLTVARTLTLNGDLNLSSATLVVDSANVTVNGGTLTLGAGNAGNHLGSTAPVASVDLSNGGGLALGGTTLTTNKLATTGGTFDMGATGSFIATGNVAAIPAPGSGPAQLELTGGTLSVSGADVEMPGGLQFHIDASDINNDGGATNPANGAAIANWADISGNGNDANNAWNAPVYNTAGPNGSPVVTFTNDVLSTTHNFDALEGYTMITVARYTGGANTRVFGSMDRNFLFGFHGGTTSDWHAEGWVYDGAQSDTDFHLHVGTITNEADPKASFWDNGVNRVTDSAGSHNTNYRMGRLALGGWRNNNETSNADIAEALIFEGVLSAADINNIAGHLAGKYGLAGTGYDGDFFGEMVLPGTDLWMTNETTIDVASNATLGVLIVDNADDAPTLTFTGAEDNYLKLSDTEFLNTVGVLMIENTPKVNLGVLELTGGVDPEIEKTGSGQWIVTDEIGGYTGGLAIYTVEGALVLGDPGLIGSGASLADMDNGTALKLSSSGGDQTYNETFSFNGDATILAGKADENSAAGATITLPTLPGMSSQAVTLGTTYDAYTLKIDGAVSANTLGITGGGTVTLDGGGSAAGGLSVPSGTLNVNNAPIVTPSISVTGSGSLNLGVAQSTGELLVDTSGAVNVSNPLTVTDKITLGAVEITDDASMDIVGSNLADPTGTITVSGSSLDMGPIVIPTVAPSGAVAYYAFDSVSAGVTPNAGSAGAVLNGALNGDAMLTAGLGGKSGEAMSFDGNGDYIDVEYDAVLDMSAFTVSAWVKINSEPGHYGILGTRIDGDTTFDVKVCETDIHADIGHGGGWINTAVDIGATDTGSNGQGGDLAIGQWYQVTYVVDNTGKQFRLYIDGDLKKTIGYNGTPRFMKPGQSLWIGDDYSGHEYMHGLIDEVYIYDRALNGAEVVDLFNVGTPIGGTVDIDMPNLALELASGGPSATIALNDGTPTLGDLTMGAVTDLTISVASNAGFNNVILNSGGPSTIDSGGAVPGLTVRGTLQTASSGGDLTTSFSVNGDLTMDAGSTLNAVGTVGAPITVSAKNFTSGGTVTFNEHASLALTGSALLVTGGTTTFTTDSSASGIDAIAVNPGASLVVGSDGISTAALNVPGDATLSASARVEVTQSADLGSLDIAVVGGSFGVSGADVSDDATDRTITLQGGTTIFSGAISGGGGGGLSYIPITGDADSGISLAKTYTHKNDFGNAAGTTINGVVFDRNISNGSTSIPNEHGGNYNFDIPAGQAVRELFKDMRYGDDTAEIVLNGLTPDEWYDVRLYNRSWDTGAGNRTQDFLYDVNNDGSIEDTVTLNTDNPLPVPPGLDDVNRAYAMSYVYQAEANGTIKIRINSAIAKNTLHNYGLTNELTSVSVGVSLPTTTIAASETSTLSLGTAEAVTLAGIEVAEGKTLTVDCTAPVVELTNLTLGADSMVKSTLAGGTGNVDVTVSGTLNAGGGKSYLGDPGEEGTGAGADTFFTNLSLADGDPAEPNPVFNWTFASAAETDVDGGGMMVAIDDSVNVYGALEMGAGLTIQLVDAGLDDAAGVDVALFRVMDGAAIDSVAPDVAGQWTPADLAKITILSPAGAPEPWTWDSLEFFNDEYVVLTNLVTGVVAPHPGDATGAGGVPDGVVDELDLALFDTQLGVRAADQACDFDGDGDVDVDDFAVLRAEWGWTAPPAPEPPVSETPEPATLSLLALGGVLMLRRRRRRS